MSAQRRSSSPLSSASPSPLQAPALNGDIAPLTELNLAGAATAGLQLDEDGIVGGSSQTTLTEPLTESELTEDEADDIDDADEADADEADDADDDAAEDDGGDVVEHDDAKDRPLLKR